MKAVNTIMKTQPIENQIEREYTTDVEISNPLVGLILYQVGLTDLDIFNIFQDAS